MELPGSSRTDADDGSMDVKPTVGSAAFDFNPFAPPTAADYAASYASDQLQYQPPADQDMEGYIAGTFHLGPHEHEPPDAGDEGDCKRPRLRLGASLGHRRRRPPALTSSRSSADTASRGCPDLSSRLRPMQVSPRDDSKSAYPVYADRLIAPARPFRRRKIKVRTLSRPDDASVTHADDSRLLTPIVLARTMRSATPIRPANHAFSPSSPVRRSSFRALLGSLAARARSSRACAHVAADADNWHVSGSAVPNPLTTPSFLRSRRHVQHTDPPDKQAARADVFVLGRRLVSRGVHLFDAPPLGHPQGEEERQGS